MVGGRFHRVGLSDKIRTPPPYLLDTAVLFPSRQPAAIQEAAVDLVARAASALGIDNAPIHAEVMVTPKGPMMVELAARGPGFKVFTDMIPWSSGIDVLANLIALSLGEATSFPAPLERGSVLLFPPARPGRVRAVTGVEAGRAVPHVVDLEIYVKPGESVRLLTSGSDRVGHIIALADTREAAETAARTAERAVTIAVEEPA